MLLVQWDRMAKSAAVEARASTVSASARPVVGWAARVPTIALKNAPCPGQTSALRRRPSTRVSYARVEAVAHQSIMGQRLRLAVHAMKTRALETIAKARCVLEDLLDATVASHVY